jgi:hypothetical protein
MKGSGKHHEGGKKHHTYNIGIFAKDSKVAQKESAGPAKTLSWMSSNSSILNLTSQRDKKPTKLLQFTSTSESRPNRRSSGLKKTYLSLKHFPLQTLTNKLPDCSSAAE